MPLVVMCGNPASGKTTRAKNLAEYLTERHGTTCAIVGEEQLGIGRDEGYCSSQAQKVTRSRVKAEVARQLSKDAVVIADSLNYIKGFRYQLFCLAREAKTTYCVIYVNATTDDCLGLNKKRQNGYGEELLRDLCKRMEQPVLKNRWDVPLFERRLDQSTPIQDIAQVLLFQPKRIKDPVATKAVMRTEVDQLSKVDQAVQSLIEEIVEQQAARGTQIVVGRGGMRVGLKERWGVGELRGVKTECMRVVRGSGLGQEEGVGLFLRMLGERQSR